MIGPRGPRQDQTLLHLFLYIHLSTNGTLKCSILYVKYSLNLLFPEITRKKFIIWRTSHCFVFYTEEWSMLLHKNLAHLLLTLSI